MNFVQNSGGLAAAATDRTGRLKPASTLAPSRGREEKSWLPETSAVPCPTVTNQNLGVDLASSLKTPPHRSLPTRKGFQIQPTHFYCALQIGLTPFSGGLQVEPGLYYGGLQVEPAPV
jgi:hypothetical protein